MQENIKPLLAEAQATLAGRRIAVFDCEIKKPIEKCSKGWQSHGEMGVSVLCVYDYASGRYRVFDDSNAKEAMEMLQEFDLVVGFNTVGFDWKLLRASWPHLVRETRRSQDYDVLREIWVALGLDPDCFAPRTHGGYKLDDVAFDSIGMQKSGSGELAPKLFEAGRFAELVDYCLEDVRIEKTLFEYVVATEHVCRKEELIKLRQWDSLLKFNEAQPRQVEDLELAQVKAGNPA